MKFEIQDCDGLARLGSIEVNGKYMNTPNLFPVVHPYRNLIPSDDLVKLGTQCIFTNSYIIYRNERIREEVTQKGIHEYLKFLGIIATDSGAFQQYMYNYNNFEIDAYEIESFQEKIRSDFPVILDVPVQLDDDYETAKQKVNITLKRARENIRRRNRLESHWFGPIHGGQFVDLLKYSTNEMSQLPFDLYALGGLVKAFMNYEFTLAIEMLLHVKTTILSNKPLHMFGLGLPQFFSLAIACGCDLMDSAAYILYAKQGRYFTLSTGTKKLDELIEFPCHCPICTSHTPDELRKFDEDLKIKLLAKHNLHISFSELRTIRQSIREGNLWELVEQRIRGHPNLVNAFQRVKNFLPNIEKYEKTYKNHGRMFVSSESTSRPAIYRYNQIISTKYRKPKESKFLIILPELDLNGQTSPSIGKWIRDINVNQSINRNNLHVALCSKFFGIIPWELIDTFPMGQNESLEVKSNKDLIVKHSLQLARNFFENHAKNYNACALLIPEKFLDQHGQSKDFPLFHPIYGLKEIIQAHFGSKGLFFTTLTSIFNFLTEVQVK